MRLRSSWHQYALLLAEAAATRSEDPRHRVGAVILRKDHSVAGVGYNGAPPGREIDWEDDEYRRAVVTHAETNALRYTTPEQTDGGMLACTRHPCARCLSMAAGYGIRELVVGEPFETPGDDRDWKLLTNVVNNFGFTRIWMPLELVSPSRATGW